MEPVEDPNIISPLRLQIEQTIEQAAEQMKEWLSRIYPPYQIEKAMHAKKKEQYRCLKVRIWTATNCYSIIASFHNHMKPENGYLGAQVTCRKPRTGENWGRGRDLSDGRFNEETWLNILYDIVKCEAEEIKSEKWKFVP